MKMINNVNVGMLEQVAKQAETDKSTVRRTQKIEGEWLAAHVSPSGTRKVACARCQQCHSWWI